MIRWMFRLSVCVVLMVAAAWFIGRRMLDTTFAERIQQGSSEAMGVRVTIGSLHYDPMTGRLLMDRFVVGNIPGYPSPYLISVAQCLVTLDPWSILGSAPTIESMTLDGVDVNIEQRFFRSNTAVLNRNLKAYSAEQTVRQGSTDKREVIDELRIENISAKFNVAVVGKEQNLVTVKIPSIVLHDVPTTQIRGRISGIVADQVVAAVLDAVVEHGRGLVPDQMLHSIGGEFQSAGRAAGEGIEKLFQSAEIPQVFDSVGQGARNFSRGAEQTMHEIGRNAGQTAQGVGQDAQNAAQGLGRGVNRIAEDVGRTARDFGDKFFNSLPQ